MRNVSTFDSSEFKLDAQQYKSETHGATIGSTSQKDFDKNIKQIDMKLQNMMNYMQEFFTNY